MMIHLASGQERPDEFFIKIHVTDETLLAVGCKILEIPAPHIR